MFVVSYIRFYLQNIQIYQSVSSSGTVGRNPPFGLFAR